MSALSKRLFLLQSCYLFPFLLIVTFTSPAIVIFHSLKIYSFHFKYLFTQVKEKKKASISRYFLQPFFISSFLFLFSLFCCNKEECCKVVGYLFVYWWRWIEEGIWKWRKNWGMFGINLSRRYVYFFIYDYSSPLWISINKQFTLAYHISVFFIFISCNNTCCIKWDNSSTFFI